MGFYFAKQSDLLQLFVPKIPMDMELMLHITDSAWLCHTLYQEIGKKLGENESRENCENGIRVRTTH